MKNDFKAIVSIDEATHDFSKVARLVDQYGSAVITKDDTPCYVVMEYSEVEQLQDADTDEIAEISKRLLERNAAVYEELAK